MFSQSRYGDDDFVKKTIDHDVAILQSNDLLVCHTGDELQFAD